MLRDILRAHVAEVGENVKRVPRSVSWAALTSRLWVKVPIAHRSWSRGAVTNVRVAASCQKRQPAATLPLKARDASRSRIGEGYRHR